MLGRSSTCEISTPYADDAGILLLMKGKLTIGKVKPSRLSMGYHCSPVFRMYRVSRVLFIENTILHAFVIVTNFL